MNIIEQEDIIKGLPDQALQQEAKQPSGQVPQFLVVSEIQRRTDMRKRYQASQQQPQGTTADQIMQEGISTMMPPQQRGANMRFGRKVPSLRNPVRMQAGGRVQMGQDGFFEQRIRDAIAQGVDPSQLINAIGSRFGPDAVQQAMSIISPQVSADVVSDNFSNSMTEDAARSDNILATVNDATPEEAQAVNNPVSVNLPEKVNYEPSDALVLAREQAKKDAYLTDLYASVGREYKSPMISKILQENQSMAPDEPKKDSRLPERSALSSISDVFADIGSNVSSDMKKMGNVFGGSGTTSRGNVLTSSPDVLDASPTLSLDELIAKNETDKFSKKFPSAEEGALISQEIGEGLSNAGKYATSGGNFINDFVTSGDFSSPYEAGRTISSSVTQPLSFLSNKLEEGAEGAYNLTADALEPIEDFGRGIFGADKRKGKGFRYNNPTVSSPASRDVPPLLKRPPETYLPQLANPDLFSTLRRQEDASKVIDSEIINSVTTESEVTGGANNAVTDGAVDKNDNRKTEKVAGNSANLLDKILNLNLDGAQKEAYAMAMIQLGAGIAKGDLAEGLSNAGVAASGVMSKARDRADKQLDRQIQSKYYDDKLADSQEMRRFRINQAVENALNDWKESNFGATKEQIDSKRKELMSQFSNNLGDTITTGDNLGGGNQRNVVNVNYNDLKTS